MVIESIEQIEQVRKNILQNAEASLETVRNCLDTMPAMRFFAEIKFSKMGKDPITGNELNLIEQINQMYSDLVALAAVQDLLTTYPDKLFEMHLGPTSGYDIQSTDGEVVAECFAATTVASNDKMNKDCKKLLKAKAIHKHLYFYSCRDREDIIQRRIAKYSEIKFKQVHY